MDTVAVYGLGRFGAFWAKLLSTHFNVIAYSRSPDRVTPDGVTRVSEDEVLRAPVQFFCVAISAFENVIRRISTRVGHGAVIFDTCSVKVHPARVMEDLLPDSVEIVASHPMFGPDSARDGVQGLPLILCPVRAQRTVVDHWSGFFSSLGLHVSTMSPDEHDKEAAFTQGIAHYIGRVLADLHLAGSDIGTLGYNKLLEIIEQTCNDPWQLFIDLQRYNPHTREMRERLYESLQRIMALLDTSLDTSDHGENNGAGAGSD